MEDETSVAATKRLPEHFDTFYRREFGRVLGLVYSLSGNRWAAEDIAQEAFLRAHRNWDEVGAYEYPAAWVKRVASNLAISRFRRLKSEAKAITRLIGRHEHALAPLDPVDSRFWEEVRKLSPSQAKVVALHYLEDMAVDDIARVLEMSPNTVKTQLHRARARLEDRLSQLSKEDA